MIQTIIRAVGGYVKIRVQGYSPERFLNLCRHHQIYIWGLHPSQNAYEMYVSLKGFRRLKPIVRKTHTKVILIKRYGLPFFLYRHRRREAFAVSLLLCIGLLFLYSSCIWDIHFDGNEKWPDETLLEFLHSTSVTPGMKKSSVDCAQIVKDIRKEYNDIVWVSASIDGSLLRIRIKENEDTFQEGEEEGETVSQGEGDEKESTPTDLVASCDGVITSMITRKGVPLVHVGDTVKKGDILVSGRVEVLNDAGEVVNYQYQQSDADIYADTQLSYQDTMPASYEEKHYKKKGEKRQWYLRIGSCMFSLGSVKHKGETCEIYTEEHRIKLGENFYLPIFYGCVRIREYDTEKKPYSREEIREILTKNFLLFSEDLQEKGIQIYENNVKIHLSKTSAAATGTLFLNQKITETADTEILEVERMEQNESNGTDD